MKLLGQIASVEPLALIVSLPNQLMAHVPITHISSQLTQLLETMGEDDPSDVDSDDEDANAASRVPELHEIFHPGQYVRAIVTEVHAQGVSNQPNLGRARDEAQKASRRVELSLIPEKVNDGVAKGDLKAGFVSKLFPSLTSVYSFSVRVDAFSSYQECRRSRLHTGLRHSGGYWFPLVQGS